MVFDPEYHESKLSREEIDQLQGPVLVEFGASWCGICGAFSPQLQQIMADFPDVQHIRIEDGRGKRLGRSFRVKLWPTLVFMRDGRVVQQIARPSRHEARQGLVAITEHTGAELDH
jgi:thioredoxin 1